MSENIKSLWSAQIRPKILSPYAILNAQAAALAKQTSGLLLGEIRRRDLDEKKTTLSFNIVVPLLDGYRHGILVVGHRKDLPYPCIIDAEVFRPASLQYYNLFLKHGNLISQFSANSDKEFISYVEKVLNSSDVLSIAQSLIARATDALSEKDQQTGSAAMSLGEASIESRVSEQNDQGNPDQET